MYDHLKIIDEFGISGCKSLHLLFEVGNLKLQFFLRWTDILPDPRDYFGNNG